MAEKSSMRGLTVLAGGLSTRFGEDKAFKSLGGKPLLQRVLERTLPVVDEAVVVIRQNSMRERYLPILPLNVKLENDKKESQGPLVGILTGFRVLLAEYSAVLSCDCPFVEGNVIARLFREAEGRDAAVPKWPDGRLEPLHAVYKRRVASAAAEEAVSAGELSNRDMIKRLEDVAYVDVNVLREHDPELVTFRNFNTKTEFEEAERLLASVES